MHALVLEWHSHRALLLLQAIGALEDVGWPLGGTVCDKNTIIDCNCRDAAPNFALVATAGV